MQEITQSLWEIKENSKAIIDIYNDSIRIEYKSRLLELGFSPSTEITCLKITPFNGPRVFEVSGSIFTLERDLAKNIFVKALNE